MSLVSIYKDILLKPEATWGVSAAGQTNTLSIISSTLELDPTNKIVEDTRTSFKGNDQIIQVKNVIKGDIKAYATPTVIRRFFELAVGRSGVTTAVGTSALLFTYNQNTDGNLQSATIVQDRNSASEVFYGVRGKKLSMNFKDAELELTLSVEAQGWSKGPGVPDVIGETVKPYTFADATVTIAAPAYANPYTLLASDMTIEYDNGLVSSFLSGSRNASRSDPGVPKLSGEFTIFHEGNSWVDAAFGQTELNLRVEFTTNSGGGLIAGVTPYYLKLDIPRARLMSTKRTLEAGKLTMETVKFAAIFDTGSSSLWTPAYTDDWNV